VSATSSDPALVAADGFVFGGSDGARTLRVRPVPNATGAATIVVTVSDGQASASQSFALTVTPVNDAPTVSEVPDQAMLADGSLTVPFTIGDVDNALGDLKVHVASSNDKLVRGKDLTLGGSGANRTLTITPKKNHHGTTTITITVTDGTLTTTETFVLTVNCAPWISPVGDQRIAAGSTETVAFVVLDVESAPGQLTVTAQSSNPAVVPADGLVLGSVFHGLVRTLAVTPAAGTTGSAVITLTVSDGLHTDTETFTVTTPRGR
jgi:hypothetical protein